MTQINLKNYIKEHSLCSELQTGIRLNGQGSFVNFQFDVGVAKYTIEFIALRGADHSIIINGTPHLLKPNTSTFIDVHFNVVNIKRSGNARGHIIVARVFDDKQIIQTDNEINDLHNSFLKISKLKGVHVLKGIHKTDIGLFAKEFAEIENEKLIISLETDPYNSYIRKNNKIIFIHPCRILTTNIVKNIVEVQPEVKTSAPEVQPVQPEANLSFSYKMEQRSTLSKYRNDILNNSLISASVPNKIFGNIDLVLKPRTWSMNNWVSKFCNLFNGVKVISKQIQGCNVSEETDSVLLTDIYNIIPSNKIFLEEFCDVIDSKSIEILKKCKLIATTSVMNAQLLRTINKNVVYVPKYWPVFNVAERLIQEQYNLLICRDKYITIKFIEAYKISGIKTKLVVVGYRGQFLDCEFYDEFLSHDKLLSLILYSSSVIDFPSTIHYYSGLLDLSLIANKNIITTNHWLSISKPQANVINSVIKNGKLCPNITDAVSALNLLKDKKPNIDLESYNYNLLGTLMILRDS